VQERLDSAAVADRLAHEFNEAAASARLGGQTSLAAEFEAKAQVLAWSASLRRSSADGAVVGSQ